MSRATRMLAKDETRPLAEKSAAIERLSRARTQAGHLRRSITTEQELNTYSALWHDRQFLEPAVTDANTPPMPGIDLREGMTIEHTHFGEGLVETVFTIGDDMMVTIDFIGAGRRTFMLKLLADTVSVVK